MSICTFIASNHPLPSVEPSQDYPFEINLDIGTIYDGDADDNFFLTPFRDVSFYTDKKYGVSLKWRYTCGRTKQLLRYINNALQNTDRVELWHVWLMDYYEYEDSPVIHSRTVSIEELTAKDITELDEAEVFNRPDKRHPDRPSFYQLIVTR